MIHLLDLNVLLALVDPASRFHAAAKAFFQNISAEGWATCPLTENGFIRILGNPSFPGGPGSTDIAREILTQWRSLPGHQFWPDEITLCDRTLLPGLPPAKHLTDCYLLALAVKRKAGLATFDRGIDASRVRGGAKALVVLELEAKQLPPP